MSEDQVSVAGHNPAPARIHVLLAGDSKLAIVLRRGPSRQTAAIGWDRKDDSFFVGQWFKGTVFNDLCDISPDGKHWIYFARKNWKTLTCVAKVPYFTALDFYHKDDSYAGGGLFLNNRSYFLNDGGIERHTQRKKGSSMSVTTDCPPISKVPWRDFSSQYFLRLIRDGWQEKPLEPSTAGKRHEVFFFAKRVNDYWNIVKRVHYERSNANKPAGYEDHVLANRKTGEEFLFAGWEWADLDGSRLLWAEKGAIYAGIVNKQGLGEARLLFDCNALRFASLAAPY